MEINHRYNINTIIYNFRCVCHHGALPMDYTQITKKGGSLAPLDATSAYPNGDNLFNLR